MNLLMNMHYRKFTNSNDNSVLLNENFNEIELIAQTSVQVTYHLTGMLITLG